MASRESDRSTIPRLDETPPGCDIRGKTLIDRRQRSRAFVGEPYDAAPDRITESRHDLRELLSPFGIEVQQHSAMEDHHGGIRRSGGRGIRHRLEQVAANDLGRLSTAASP